MKIPRQVKHWWQRRTRGWDDSVTYSLDKEIAKFVYPRLVRFKELNHGSPTTITKQRWDEILDDIIYAMEIYSVGVWEYIGDDKADWKRVKRGLRAFGNWFPHLWT